MDAFIRLANSSFAEESIAAGITPEEFAIETRRIFRWKMLPYKLLTALMGIQWEAFVAEIDSKVVGGGMYIGQNNRMSITNLMVEPEYRRHGIGQALLIKRLERLAERGFPYAVAQVLDTNVASLENLKKQNFEVFNQYSVFERDLPLPEKADSVMRSLAAQEITHSDRTLLSEIEKRTTSPYVLFLNGSADTQYFPSRGQGLYARFAGYSRWTKAFVAQGETVGFIGARFHRLQRKGMLFQPIVADEHLGFLREMFQAVGAWLNEASKESMVIEIPGNRSRIQEFLLENGWRKTYTWLELIRWLDEGARQKFDNL